MNRRLSRTTFALVAGAVLVAGVFAGCAPRARLTPDEAESRIREAFEKATRGHAEWAGASVLVHSDALGIHTLIRADPEGPDAYHIASVGKIFTAVLIGRQIDAGRIGFDSRVSPFFEPGFLDGLFVRKGRDYQGEVTVGQLLAHTSGAADYFEDPAKGGRTVSELIVEEPDRIWTPLDLVDFTRREQEAVGMPGETFHYSDTGYIILGLLAEELSGMPFDELLAREILGPLGMERTWMPFRSHPAGGGGEKIRRAWLHKTEVSTFPSITADWAGGGIVSTEEDLLRFQQALWSGRLLSGKTLSEMQEFDGVFRRGIHYGKGLMQYRFGEFFFLLKDYPPMIGHMGILGTQLFYDPENDIHLIVNFGSDDATGDSVRLIIRVMGILLRTG
jgi:D-alanyl-D-alanine carboxypeptidase